MKRKNVKKRNYTNSHMESLDEALDRLRDNKDYFVKFGMPDLNKTLQDCLTGKKTCGLSCCPLCTRKHRIWRTEEFLEIARAGPLPQWVLTLLFDAVAPGDLHTVEPKKLQHRLRKRLDTAGLSESLVAGGLEVSWHGNQLGWSVHFHVLTLGAEEEHLRALKASFASSDLKRPFLRQKLKDPMEQISYLLKFHTYHHPFAQIGQEKGPAYPLPRPQMEELLSWYANFKPSDFLFLYGLRRQGKRILPTGKGRSAKR